MIEDLWENQMFRVVAYGILILVLANDVARWIWKRNNPGSIWAPYIMAWKPRAMVDIPMDDVNAAEMRRQRWINERKS